MSKPRRNTAFPSQDDTLFAVKQRKPVPHEFVLDALAPLSPATRPMFGCLAIYVQDKIVLILRDKRDPTADNGVWLATTEEHHQSLRREFPNMRSIQVLGKKVTFWQGILESGRCRARAGPREREPGRRRRSQSGRRLKEPRKLARGLAIRRDVTNVLLGLYPVNSRHKYMLSS